MGDLGSVRNHDGHLWYCWMAFLYVLLLHLSLPGKYDEQILIENTNSGIALIRNLRKDGRKGPRLRIVEDRSISHLPIPPRWRCQRGAKGRSKHIERRYCAQREPTKGAAREVQQVRKGGL